MTWRRLRTTAALLAILAAGAPAYALGNCCKTNFDQHPCTYCDWDLFDVAHCYWTEADGFCGCGRDVLNNTCRVAGSCSFSSWGNGCPIQAQPQASKRGVQDTFHLFLRPPSRRPAPASGRAAGALAR